MAIRAFEVGGLRGLIRAEATNLPNLVGIAGPNGSGKSALLEQLWQLRGSFLEPGTEALYVGPNRTWRAGALTDLSARGYNLDYEQILKTEVMPSFGSTPPAGLHWLSGISRFGSNADDAQALVKTSIVRIANRAESFIAREFARQGQRIEPGTVPDLLDPLRELINTLLPHLEFVRVDQTNPQNVEVLFRSRDPLRVDVTFDIDQLSSGEKAAVALFLPFIERTVRNIARDPGFPTSQGRSISVLLDEPEIHLHPLLQLNVLDYMRQLAQSNEAQFIFTTHSPTLLDSLDPDELFLLSPAPLSPENQLARLSESTDKLEAARAITGATHVLTRGKPIVLIEGKPDEDGTTSDHRIIKLLVRESEHWAVVPSGGRGQVTKAVADLRSARLSLPGMPAFGLVDGDQNFTTSHQFVITWPVAMVENLLINADVIEELLSPYFGVLGVFTEDKISGIFNRISGDRRGIEIQSRVSTRLPSHTLRAVGYTEEEIQTSLTDQVEAYRARLSSEKLLSEISAATDEVDLLISSNQQLDRFHGKAMLRAFYNEIGMSRSGLGWNAFVTELARRSATHERTRLLTQSAVSRIVLFFPRELPAALHSSLPAGDDKNALINRCELELSNWERSAPTGSGREDLREVVMRAGRNLRDTDPVSARKIVDLAASIGTLS